MTDTRFNSRYPSPIGSELSLDAAITHQLSTTEHLDRVLELKDQYCLFAPNLKITDSAVSLIVRTYDKEMNIGVAEWPHTKALVIFTINRTGEVLTPNMAGYPGYRVHLHEAETVAREDGSIGAVVGPRRKGTHYYIRVEALKE